jgi:protein-S-isoprenylcysteine O-methyltransferase Ste14
MNLPGTTTESLAPPGEHLQAARAHQSDQQVTLGPALALTVAGAAGAVAWRVLMYGQLSVRADLLPVLYVAATGLVMGLLIAAVSNHAANRRVAAAPVSALRRVRTAVRPALFRGAFVSVSACMAYVLYHALPHYQTAAYRSFLQVTDLLLAAFVILPIPYHLLMLTISPAARFDPGEKSLILAARLRLTFRRRRPFLRGLRRLRCCRRTRAAVLSFVVKVFFLPLMVGSLIGMKNRLSFHVAGYDPGASWPMFVYAWLVPLMTMVCLSLDLLIYALGYLAEFRWLGNRIKSVDPFISGWLVCLLCYYPFVGLTSVFVPEYENLSMRWLGPAWLIHLSQLGIVLCQGLWVCSTLSLGFRASNLTNRGIVTCGPYRCIRHPAYAGRMLWLIAATVGAGRAAALPNLVVMLLLYVLRSLTEERHLCAAQEYRAYCARVRWRFVPGLV